MNFFRRRAPLEELPPPFGGQLVDLDTWLQEHGLRAPNEEPRLTEPTLEEQETRARLAQESHYQAALHHRFFPHEDEEPEEKHPKDRVERLKEWKEAKVDLISADGVVHDVPLLPLAESCDTIYTVASNWELFRDTAQGTSNNPTISLTDYHMASIRDFLRLINGTRTAESMPGQSVVECCQMAHYLQNEPALEATAKVLVQSVDTANCLCLSQLADQLGLHQLFERSLSHMMDSLDDLQDNELWDDLSPELRDRIAAIQAAISTSLHSSEKKQPKLYFCSLEEYIAIFAERVQYYRERLAEAKEQQQALEEERHVQTEAWRDAQEKIDRQEQRVRTLETALAEQKKLFANKN